MMGFSLHSFFEQSQSICKSPELKHYSQIYKIFLVCIASSNLGYIPSRLSDLSSKCSQPFQSLHQFFSHSPSRSLLPLLRVVQYHQGKYEVKYFGLVLCLNEIAFQVLISLNLSATTHFVIHVDTKLFESFLFTASLNTYSSFNFLAHCFISPSELCIVGLVLNYVIQLEVDQFKN